MELYTSMTTPLELTIVYADEGFGTALGNQPLTLPEVIPQPAIYPPMRVPGAMGGWFELVVTFGGLTLPAGVLASCIANWITSAITHRRLPDASLPRAKLVFERDGRSVEIELTASDPASLADAIEKTLDRVHSER